MKPSNIGHRVEDKVGLQIYSEKLKWPEINSTIHR